MKYTKGEWTVQTAQPYDEYEYEISYDTKDGLTYPIADVHGKLERGGALANANLIAAAPEMYEALKSWEELWNMRPIDSGEDMQQTLKRCWLKTRKALAKAEGN